MEQLVECELARETKVIGENLHLYLFVPQQIPYDLT
jgi:hypothetical protein